LNPSSETVKSTQHRHTLILSVLILWSRLTHPSISDGNLSGDFPTNNQYLLHFPNDMFVNLNDCKTLPELAGLEIFVILLGGTDTLYRRLFSLVYGV
jgi:hypothetical protein